MLGLFNKESRMTEKKAITIYSEGLPQDLLEGNANREKMQNAKWKTFRSVSPNHDASAS
jgi:hypothetical protein